MFTGNKHFMVNLVNEYNIVIVCDHLNYGKKYFFLIINFLLTSNCIYVFR